VRPWSAIKSRRGAPKLIDTQGFTCPNRSCPYYRIADARLHALVGDGAHGKRERIQSLRCQACGTTFSTRRNTPLYGLKTPSLRIGEVLTALAEGLDVSAATRVFGHRHATIMSWLTRAAEHSAALHDRTFRNLHLPTSSWMNCVRGSTAERTRYGCGSWLTHSARSFPCSTWADAPRTWLIWLFTNWLSG